MTRGPRRYKAAGNWRELKRIGPCVIDVCDAIEDGREVWSDGVHRVRFVRKVEGFRGKTFIGELAWASAERLAYDAEAAERYR